MASKMSKPTAVGHTAGIFADMTLDGPEIGTLVAVIDRAKNLPNRKTMGKQNPYCAMRLGKEAKKTETDRRGGQTPKWDQELRFTVHESPDYYKLKCSVFNDDKRTDLIGEAWVDLSDLIKPGGGSNDLWHQLNYKGKYAGDVRIELTYYDLRPREEKVCEKKRHREKTYSDGRDTFTPNETSVNRQLGPREVRRRPLPVSPANSSPMVMTPVSTPSAPTTSVEVPTPPPKIPLDQVEILHDSSLPQSAPQHVEDEYVFDQHTFSALAIQNQDQQQYRQPFCEDQLSTSDYHDDSTWSNVYSQPSEQSYEGSYSALALTPSSWSASSWPEATETWSQNNHRKSSQYTDLDGQFTSSIRALPYPPTHSLESSHNLYHNETALTMQESRRDTSLEEIVNRRHSRADMVEEPESYNATPPLPPAHRETTPRRYQPEHPPSSFSQNDRSVVPHPAQSSYAASKRSSCDARSPLQQIERDYDYFAPSQVPHHRSAGRQHSHDAHDFNETDRRQQRYDARSVPQRHSMYGSLQGHDYHSSHLQSASGQGDHVRTYQDMYSGPNAQRPSRQSRSGSYDGHRLSGNPFSTNDSQSSVPHSNSQSDLSQSDIYRPQPIRPRPSSRDPGQIPPRKAVTPNSHPQHDGSRMSKVPFNPDGYDVLNPASSFVTNDGTIFQTPQQAKEAARMKEVERIREQGPIIGNDGRIIDPSDHLPSDTWAPEPERKQRRPEHVIHYRTRNDAHSHVITAGSSSSPSSWSGHQRQTPTQNRPSSSTALGSQPTPPSGNRNRLQKPAQSRPLPTQPYPQQGSAWSAESHPNPNPSSEPSIQKAAQRYSYQEIPSSVHRPRLSEYQVPVSSDHIPRRSSYYDDPKQNTPSSQMQTGRDYSPRNRNVYDDPLATELSMIDIGPSRSGQMVLASRRGY